MYGTINALFMRIFLFLALLLAAPLALFADQEPVRVELVTSHQEIKAGEELEVVVQFHLQAGWHTYWKNPGQAGAPVSIKWQLPPGFTVGEILWPTPSSFEENGMTIYGYDKDFSLLARIKTPVAFDKDSFEIGAVASWVACGDYCLPGKKILLQNVFVGSERVSEMSKTLFHAAKEAIPAKSPQITEAAGSLLVDIPGVTKASFIPDQGSSAKVEVTRDKKVLISDFTGPVKGVLQVEHEGQLSSYELDHLPGADFSINFFVILLAAFGGGLILNLMPCVFPVLSLKVLSVIESAGQEAKKRVVQALAYGVGVVISFLGIGALLLVLRASGNQIGWGFQLQEPLFVAFLIGLFFLMGLNLFGLFEMGTSLTALENKNRQEGVLGAFMSGILATVVATPCTGPLLGSTLGLTLTLPAMASMLIFAVMALGLALPFMLLMMVPALAKLLPKPGAWMVRLKQAMGFLMMAAVLWLVWVFEAETDFAAVLWMLAGLLVTAIAAWIWGTWGEMSRPRPTRFLSLALATGMVLGAAAFVVNTVQKEHRPAVALVSGDWQTFTPALLEKLIAENKPVFVDFTAKWCLICQANKAVLHSDPIAKAFHEKGVVLLKADWTKGDPMITEYLKKFQRSGVPLYIYYSGKSVEPTVLPETLTPSLVLDALH